MSVLTELNRIKTAISNAITAIKNKGVTVPTTAKVGDLATYIGEIITPNLQSKTVSPLTSQQTVTPDSGYNGLSQVTVNAISKADRATTSISVTADDTNDRLTLTASNNQSTGYVEGSNQTASKVVSLVVGTPAISSTGVITATATASTTGSGTTLVSVSKSSAKQLTTQAARTITPTTSNLTAVLRGRYTTGDVVVKGDASLIPSNIRSGVSIFGVAGSYSGSGGGGGSATISTGTVYINTLNAAGGFIDVWYSCVEDGQIVQKFTFTDPETETPLENVVTGSIFVLAYEEYNILRGLGDALGSTIDEGYITTFFNVVATEDSSQEFYFYE